MLLDYSCTYTSRTTFGGFRTWGGGDASQDERPYESLFSPIAERQNNQKKGNLAYVYLLVWCMCISATYHRTILRNPSIGRFFHDDFPRRTRGLQTVELATFSRFGLSGLGSGLGASYDSSRTQCVSTIFSKKW